MTEFDVLEYKNFAYLYNVTVDYGNGKVRCGYAAMCGGLSGAIPLSNEIETVHIEVPEELAKLATWTIYMDPDDDVEFDLV